MTKITKTLTLLAFAGMMQATASHAECDGFYIAGRVGQAKYKLKDDRGSVHTTSSDHLIDKKRFLASGGIGYRYEHFRAELEYVWRKSNKQSTGIVDSKFKSYSYMFVVYYDFFPYTWFTPFVNAGIGFTRSKINSAIDIVDFNYKAKSDAFTWSLGAGISAKVTNRLNVDVGYRYYDMGDLSTLNGSTDLDDQEIYIGLRYVL